MLYIAIIYANLHNCNMDKNTGIFAINKVISSGLETRSSIALKLGIHTSQVSRVAAGKFKKMSGNALEVCKFAQSILVEKEAIYLHPEIAQRLSSLSSKLALKNPTAAQALVGMLETLIENN